MINNHLIVHFCLFSFAPQISVHIFAQPEKNKTTSTTSKTENMRLVNIIVDIELLTTSFSFNCLCVTKFEIDKIAKLC